MTSFGYLNTQEIPDEEQARFVAEHFDIWRGGGYYAELLLELNPNIILTWGLNVRAIAIADELTAWAAAHPEYDSEQYYLHYRYDTHVETAYGPLDVPGYDPECYPNCPNSSAASWEESRVPDITNQGWMVPNPRSAGLAHFYADAIHARNAWYGDLRSVIWDWSTGFCIHIDNKLENTWEYEGLQSDDWFIHPSIADFTSIIDTVSLKYQELYPEAPLLVLANGIAGFWMYNRAGGNDYRAALLNTESIDYIWQEMGVVFGERNQPNSHFLHTALHLKYMKEIPMWMEHAGIGLQVRVRDTDPTDRDKLFVLGYAYLFNDPERMTIGYLAEGQDGVVDYGLDTSHWGGPAMEYDIGLPVNNPQYVRDINGNYNTSVFYEWAHGADPGNEWQEYKIFARHYENGLVLVKVRQDAGASWDETTETTHGLGRPYLPLRADGSLGDPTSTVTLRNNEAAILIKGNTPPMLDIPRSEAVSEGQELRFTVYAHDIDLEDHLQLSAIDLPRGAALTDNGDRTGTFTWTPDYFQQGVYDSLRFQVTDGEAVTSAEMTITVADMEMPTTDASEASLHLPPGFHLQNPYRGGDAILLRTDGESAVEVAVFDVFGRRIRTLYSGPGAGIGADHDTDAGGEIRLTWDGRNDSGRDVGTGVYYLRAQSTAGRLQRRIVLIEH